MNTCQVKAEFVVTGDVYITRPVKGGAPLQREVVGVFSRRGVVTIRCADGSSPAFRRGSMVEVEVR